MHMSFLAFSNQYYHNFLSKATDYFSHMLQEKWEVKKRRKENSPKLGIRLMIGKGNNEIKVF